MGNSKSKSCAENGDNYEDALACLQKDLVHLQEWVRTQGLKVVIIFEGRDASGKGGTIKRTNYYNF